MYIEGEFIYTDGDEVSCIYFLKDGIVGNVLPRHFNTKYVDYPIGSSFGIVDIICSCFTNDLEINDWIYYHALMKREFTVMTQRTSELITLSIKNIEDLREDYESQYISFFNMGHKRLLRLLRIKLLAMKYINKLVSQK